MTILISLSPEELSELKEFLSVETQVSELLQEICPFPEGRAHHYARAHSLSRLLRKL